MNYYIPSWLLIIFNLYPFSFLTFCLCYPSFLFLFSSFFFIPFSLLSFPIFFHTFFLQISLFSSLHLFSVAYSLLLFLSSTLSDPNILFSSISSLGLTFACNSYPILSSLLLSSAIPFSFLLFPFRIPFSSYSFPL